MDIWQGNLPTQHALKTPELAIELEEEKRLKKRVYEPMERKVGVKPDELLIELRHIWGKYLLNPKSGKRLNKAVEEIYKMRKEESELIAEDAHELRKAHEMANMVLLSEVTARAALMRTESRTGMHYREDYPERDDENWLKRIVSKLVDDEIQLRTEPIQLEVSWYKPKA